MTWLCSGESHSLAGSEEMLYEKSVGDLSVIGIVKVKTIPAKSRATVMVNEDAGSGYQLSTRIKVTQGSNIIVERPMYFIFRGWDGGHDVVGYAA